MARRDARGVGLFSRNGYNFGDRIPLIAKAIEALPVRASLTARRSSSIHVASRSLTYCVTDSTTAPLCSVPSI